MSEAAYPSLSVRFTIHMLTGEAEALVDTGFDDYLAIPASMIGAFPYPKRLQTVAGADGRIIEVPIYPGSVELLDQPVPISANIIAIGDKFVLGLAMLNHFRVTFDHGQRVIVEP